MSGEEVWVVSDDEEHWPSGEEFSSREEAIRWGSEEFGAQGSTRFWVGRKDPYRANGMGEAVADYMLERLSEHSFDFAGDEVTEGWPSHSMSRTLDRVERELADRIQAVVDWYLTQDPPRFWGVKAIEEIEIPDEAPS